MKILKILTFLLCCSGLSMAQQVVSTGGYSVKSDYTLNWILGGSLSNVLIEQSNTEEIKRQQALDEMISVNVYPVPAHDFLKIEISTADTGRLAVGLFNSNGVKVLSRILPFQPVIEISLADIRPGSYLMKITRPSADFQLFETKKIIKN